MAGADAAMIIKHKTRNMNRAEQRLKLSSMRGRKNLFENMLRTVLFETRNMLWKQAYQHNNRMFNACNSPLADSMLPSKSWEGWVWE